MQQLLLQNVSLQILATLASFSGTASGFLFNVKCVVAPPCTCNNNNIQCENKHLSEVPGFTRHNKQFNSIYVDLSYNQLTIIPAYAFTNLSPVNVTDISIDLSNNYICNIEPDAFGGIENDVTYLGLHNNYLTYFPLAFSLLPSLRRLNLLRNPLVNFDTLVSANFSNIIEDLKKRSRQLFVD